MPPPRRWRLQSEQGFWEFWDSLLADRAHVDDPHLWERVVPLGLDLDRFQRDRRSDRVADRVQRDFRSGIRAGVTATPAGFAAGQRSVPTSWPPSGRSPAGPAKAAVALIRRICNLPPENQSEMNGSVTSRVPILPRRSRKRRPGRKNEYMTMFDVKSVSVEIGGAEISFETGKLARQASGAVVVRSGDTMVLCTATMGNLRDVDFLPLTVDVEERHYAVGRIPGSYFRREARAGEKATLTARMIDRPLRPLFPKGWHYETQLVSTPLSVDHVHPYDILAMNGASAALAISPVPVAEHVGAVRVGKLDGDFVVNPPEEEHENLEMDLIVSGSKDAILMVECGADNVTEAEVLDALDIAHAEIKKLVGAMEELQQKAGKEKLSVEAPSHRRGPARADPRHPRQRDRRGDQRPREARPPGGGRGDQGRRPRAVRAGHRRRGGRRRPQATRSRGRSARSRRRRSAGGSRSTRSVPTVAPRTRSGRSRPRSTSPRACTARRCSPAVRRRSSRTSRSAPPGWTCGSTTSGCRRRRRSSTTTTSRPTRSAKPGSCVVRSVATSAMAPSPSGHWPPTIPSVEDFPYVTRIVSETLESNGSSSMGSVCASSMALQAAGVPVSAPVAGVAMGLIKEDDHVIVLTDIAGVEDHLGDMDFKVAGTEGGINALQMDIKITGVTFDVLREALEQARQGRLFILGKMAEAIDGPREQLSPTAPRIESIKIDPEKIGAVIGKGGETIRGLSEEFEAQIDVEDDGTIRVYAANGELVEACIKQIEAMTREAEVGDTFKGKVVKTTTFGAFVELVKGTDGLLHISAVKPGERVETVEDVLCQGDELDVTVVEVDRERGRIGLRRSDDPAIAGKSKEELAAVGSGDRGPRGGGGGDRGGRGA